MLCPHLALGFRVQGFVFEFQDPELRAACIDIIGSLIASPLVTGRIPEELQVISMTMLFPPRSQHGEDYLGNHLL